jgi:hypothetical protein
MTLPGERKLELSILCSESDEILRVSTNALQVPGHFRLPVDLSSRVVSAAWAGKEIPFRIERVMDRVFVRVDHVLDRGELAVHLRPHPQKGRGTSPLIHPHGTITACGDTGEPSLACI